MCVSCKRLVQRLCRAGGASGAMTTTGDGTQGDEESSGQLVAVVGGGGVWH